MKKFVIFGLFTLLVLGGLLAWIHLHHLSDATIRQLAVGTWQPVTTSHVETTTDMKPDGGFSTRVKIIQVEITNSLAYEGSWMVKDGYFESQITNVTEGDEHWLPLQKLRFKVINIDSHELVLQLDGTTNLSRMERR